MVLFIFHTFISLVFKRKVRKETLKKTVFVLVLCFHISSEETQAEYKPRRRNLKTAFSLWKNKKCFSSKLRQRSFKTRQSPVHFTFAFEESSFREITGLSWRHHVQKALFAKWFAVLTKTRSRRKFQNPPAGKVYVLEKLLNRDGSVWTVGLTIEIKLRFQISRSG